MGGKLRILGVLASIAAGLALPGSALAADSFVDSSGTDTANDCHTATNPCLTINKGLTEAGTGDDVLIGGGTYSQTGGPSIPGITLANDKSLIESDFNPPATSGAAIVDYGMTPPSQAATILVSSSAANSTIQGLTIRGDGDSAGVVEVQASASIIGNVFDSANVIHVVITSGGAAPTISQNTFSSPFRGVSVNIPAGAPVIDDNIFTGVMERAISLNNSTGTGQVTENDLGISGAGAVGVYVEDSAATIADNDIISAMGSMSTSGVFATETGTAPITSAALSRNEVIGVSNSNSVGLRVDGTLGSVTLNSDIIAKHGVGIEQNPSAMTGGNVTAQNVTIADSPEFDATVAGNATLALDSSTVGDAGILLSPGTGCDVMSKFNNRDPIYPTGPGFCPATDFATQLDPMFVNPAAGDYHLLSASPLIDIGDPAAPPMGATDIDGDARALDGNGDSTVRRDVGADEFVFTQPPGGGGGGSVPPVTPPATQSGPTGQRAAALKKCKKKKSKRARRNCRKRAQRLPI